MISAANIAEVASLVGDPARANMLVALMDGQALTASELAFLAGIAPSTASVHLAKLVEARLLAVVTQGRHRYFRLASPLVARMLEGITVVAAIEAPARYRPRSIRDKALCAARTCYDHLAGRLGVAIADSLAARAHVTLDEDGGEVTASGAAFLASIGVDLAMLQRRRGRSFCRPCLDWSERRSHLAGAVGNAIAARCFELGWIERVRDSRAVAVTVAGRAGFADAFGIPGADHAD
jgi:DNA-binding transcriptional ArsR family regulator